LFSLLGTNFGGNGVQNFALPDLRGRVVIGQGQGPGLSPYVLGEVSGSQTATLTPNQMPVHTHLVQASDAPASVTRPGAAVPARTGTAAYATATDGTTMSPAVIANAGGGQPVSILPPFLVLTPCIALVGIFPSRN
jgi:microcystin-dependent protein